MAFITDSSATYTTYARPEAQRLATIDEALDRWKLDSAGGISSFTRAGAVANVTIDCTVASPQDAAWKQASAAFPGVNFSVGSASRNHFLVMAPEGCGGGHGYQGKRAVGLNAGGSLFVHDTPSHGIHTILHELGHNFSLEHAYADFCNRAGECGPHNYEDRYEVMGYTLPGYTPGSIGTYTRNWLGILQPCEAPTIGLAAGQRTTTATYDLFGRGQASGVRGLQITAPDGKPYALNFRNHTGLDAKAGYTTNTALSFGRYDAGVTVDTEETIDGDPTPVLLTRPKDASNPNGGYFGSYIPGAPFTADGVQVTVDSMSTATDPGASAQVTVTLTDPAVAVNAPLPTQTGAASVDGVADVGETLTAAPGDWTDGSCFRYQWLRDGTAIDGARSSSYTATAADDGHRITVAITGQQTGYQPLTVTASDVTIGGDVVAPTTTITSSPAAGSTDRTPTFRFTANEPATFECAIDGTDFAACTSPFTTGVLSVEEHRLTVRATDSAGNTETTPVSTTFTIAASPLTATVRDNTVQRGQAQTATGTGFQAGEIVSGTMRSDPVDLGPQAADTSGSVTFTWTVPESTDVGEHSVELAGTVSGATSATFSVTAAPTSNGGGNPSSSGGGTSQPNSGGGTDDPSIPAAAAGGGGVQPGAGGLAFTGADVAPAGIAAVLLLLFGGVLLRSRRRMNRNETLPSGIQLQQERNTDR